MYARISPLKGEHEAWLWALQRRATCGAIRPGKARGRETLERANITKGADLGFDTGMARALTGWPGEFATYLC